MMSDQQLISGIAILISGLATLKRPLSGYHWKIIGHLAWFSAVTHLSALTCLRTYFYNHQTQRNARLFFMAVLIILLLAVIGPAARFEGQRDLIDLTTWDARCYYQWPRGWPPELADALPDVFAISSFALLTLGAIFQGLKVYATFELFAKLREQIPSTVALDPSPRSWLHHIASATVAQRISNLRSFRTTLLVYMAIDQPVIAIRVTGNIYFWLFTSVFFEVSPPHLLDETSISDTSASSTLLWPWLPGVRCNCIGIDPLAKKMKMSGDSDR